METAERSVAAREWRGGWDKWVEHRGFLRQTTLSDTITKDAGHYKFVQTVKCTIPRVNPNVSYGLWVIMMYPYRFINYNKWTALVGDTVKRLCMCGHSEYMGNLCTFVSFLLKPENCSKKNTLKKHASLEFNHEKLTDKFKHSTK